MSSRSTEACCFATSTNASAAAARAAMRPKSKTSCWMPAPTKVDAYGRAMTGLPEPTAEVPPMRGTST
jgi:hypothetical protein